MNNRIAESAEKMRFVIVDLFGVKTAALQSISISRYGNFYVLRAAILLLLEFAAKVLLV